MAKKKKQGQVFLVIVAILILAYFIKPDIYLAIFGEMDAPIIPEDHIIYSSFQNSVNDFTVDQWFNGPAINEELYDMELGYLSAYSPACSDINNCPFCQAETTFTSNDYPHIDDFGWSKYKRETTGLTSEEATKLFETCGVNDCDGISYGTDSFGCTLYRKTEPGLSGDCKSCDECLDNFPNPQCYDICEPVDWLNCKNNPAYQTTVTTDCGGYTGYDGSGPGCSFLNPTTYAVINNDEWELPVELKKNVVYYINPYIMSGDMARKVLSVEDKGLVVNFGALDYIDCQSGGGGTACSIKAKYITKPIQTKQSFKGYDIKGSLDVYPPACLLYEQKITKTNWQMWLGSTKIVDENDNVECNGMNRYSFEIKASVLFPDKIQLWVNGENRGTFTVPNDEPRLKLYSTTGSYASGSSSGSKAAFKINYIAYRVPFSCQQDGQYLLGFETFAGPQTISLYSTRYPVKSFCLEHPVIVTSSTKQGSTATAEPYALLSSGRTTNIPSDQTWTLFYIFYNDGSVPIVCDEGYFDIESNRCTNQTGIAFFCSEGTFDASIGSCVVTPDIKEVCEVGRYDVVQAVCIWNPPVQAICEAGDYNSVTGKCEYEPETATVCNQGTYNPDNGMCELFPLKTIVCDQEYAYDATLDKCVKSVESYLDCEGIYTSDGRCIKDVPVNMGDICPEPALLYENPYSGVYSCIYEANFDGSCVSGAFDADLNACVISPNMDYLCINGQYDPITNTCILTPTDKIYCLEGYEYDEISGNCVEAKKGGIGNSVLYFLILSVLLYYLFFGVKPSKKTKRRRK